MMASYFELLVLVCLLLIPVLYETSQTFRYHLKFMIYYGGVSMCSVILIPAMLFRPFNCRNLLWASSLCHHISSLLALKWVLRGKEHLEKDRACIIVSNHQSSLDVLGMFDIWPVMDKCTVVAKHELFYAWPFGLAAWLSGLIFINRVRSKEAHNVLNTATEHVKSKKIKLWVYPEGTRRNTGEIHPFKKGAFHMAVEGQIPILPVVYSSYMAFLDDKNRLLNPGEIIISTLPPIPTEGLTIDDIPRLMDDVHKIMSIEYKKISEETASRARTEKIVNNISATPSIIENGKKDGKVDVHVKKTGLRDVIKAQ